MGNDSCDNIDNQINGQILNTPQTDNTQLDCPLHMLQSRAVFKQNNGKSSGPDDI